MRTQAVCVIGLVGGFLLGGCDGFGGGSTNSSSLAEPRTADESSAKTDAPPPAGLVSVARPLVPDLPVPIGFKLAENISRSYESAGARFVDHTYIGRVDKVDAERFYRLHMPDADWTLRSSQMVRGVFLMRFEKGNELCEVRIWDESSLTGPRTHVNLNVQTLGHGDLGARRDATKKD